MSLVVCIALGTECAHYIGKACNFLRWLIFPTKHPSRLFGLFSIVVNFGLISVLLGRMFSLEGPCVNDKMGAWNILALLLAIVNLSFIAYLYWKLDKKVREGACVLYAPWKVVLLDVGVIAFIGCAIIGTFVLQVVGSKWSSESGCSEEYVDLPGALFFIYLIGLGVLFWASIITCCGSAAPWTQQVILLSDEVSIPMSSLERTTGEANFDWGVLPGYSRPSARATPNVSGASSPPPPPVSEDLPAPRIPNLRQAETTDDGAPMNPEPSMASFL